MVVARFLFTYWPDLNRKAVPLEAALGYILTDFGYDDKEVTLAVNSAYVNIQEFGKNENSKIVIPRNEGTHQTKHQIDDEDKPKPTQIDRLELFLSSKYVFRHNIVSGKLEYQQLSGCSSSGRPGGAQRKWNVMNDFIENSMLRECLKARIRTNISSLRNLLNSDFCPLFNPFEDYFGNLPTYDEKED